MISTDSDKGLRADVLTALADPTRAAIVEMLAARPHTAGDLHAAFTIAAPAVSRHLRVLREAGLIDERRPPHDRRLRVYALNPQPLEQLGSWLAELSQTWQTQLDAFREYVAVRAERPEDRA